MHMKTQQSQENSTSQNSRAWWDSGITSFLYVCYKIRVRLKQVIINLIQGTRNFISFGRLGKLINAALATRSITGNINFNFLAENAKRLACGQNLEQKNWRLYDIQIKVSIINEYSRISINCIYYQDPENLKPPNELKFCAQ